MEKRFCLFMEENKIIEAGSIGSTRNNSSKKYFIWLVALVLVGVGVYAGAKFYSYKKDTGRLNAVDAYLDVFKNDTFGGKTPEETLKLFIEALKQGDVEKASLYFLPDDNGSRERWLKFLAGVKSKDLLAIMAKDLETKAKPAGSSYENNFVYQILDSEGIVAVDMNFVFNGKVWKIESF